MAVVEDDLARSPVSTRLSLKVPLDADHFIVFIPFTFIAFSWKQKNQLGIDGKKRAEFRVHPSGTDLTELTDFFSEARGDMEIDLTDLKEFTEPSIPVINKYKVIDVSSLYGSKKACGPIVVDHIPYTGPFTKRKMSKGRML